MPESQPTIEAFGFELPIVNKPSNLQDFTDAFGADQTYAMATAYRQSYLANGARNSVLDAIEKVTGVAQGDDEINVKYASRALAEAAQTKFGGDMNACKAAVSEALTGIVVNYTKEPERRSGGPKKLGVLVLKRAQDILDKKGQKGAQATIAGLTSYLPADTHPQDAKPEDDGSYSADALARWLVAFDKHEEAEKEKKQAALMGS